ncbi:unnamed protein product [Orchesella dallaii]|uniref:Uncharacterized protein n=1 Tax=Orchesella dallaii TaxID=48710 RepID=A0ABP1SAK2_9HEXA
MHTLLKCSTNSTSQGQNELFGTLRKWYLIGVGSAGIIKGSVFAAVQSAAAVGKGYIGSSLLGFGSSGIAKGSIAAGLQAAGATGAGIAGSTLIPVAVAGGAVCASLVYMYRRSPVLILHHKVKMNWVSVAVLLCATLLVPPTSAVVLEMQWWHCATTYIDLLFISPVIGLGSGGIIKGSVFAAVQSAAAVGKGYIGTSLLGFGSSGIAKGSIAAGLQSAGATGAGIAGTTLIPVAVAGGAVCASLMYMYRRR